MAGQPPQDRPILDYAPRPRRSRLRRWLKRLAIAACIPLGIFACLVGWLYWGWHSEQEAIAFVRSRGSSGAAVEPMCPKSWAEHIPSHFRWLVERCWIVEMTEAGDADLDCLKALGHLKSLWLHNARPADGILTKLRYWPRLNLLALDGPGFTDAALVHLKHCPTLTQLFLMNSAVTDAGLPTVRGCTALRELYLTGTPITDAAVKHLETMNGLRYLELMRTRVTPEAAGRLRQTMPHCRIDF